MIKPVMNSLYLQLSFVLIATVPATASDPGIPGHPPAGTINEVYLAQTHVLQPTDPFFVLSANRRALIKVNITGSGAAPAVTATVFLNGGTEKITLTGPASLPATVSTSQHSFDNSFTGDIPAGWIQPGLEILVQAGAAQKRLANINVSADHELNFRLFDFIVFGSNEAYHPFTEEVYQEMEAKWPISKLNVDYKGKFYFPAFSVNPEKDKGLRPRIITADQEGNPHSLTFLKNMDAMQRANGEFYTTYYGVGMSIAGGGWGGGTRFAGISSHGVFWHEFGHALSLPHNNDNPSYPYKGNGVSQYEYFVGTTWGYDPIHRYFIPPTIQANAVGAEEYVKNREMGRYKHDPMWQQNTNQMEKGYHFMLFSDYNTRQIKQFLEKTYHRKGTDGNYQLWSASEQKWVDVRLKVWDVPREENLPVYTLLGTVSPEATANIIYDPMAYTGNLVRTYDPTKADDRKAMVADEYCDPCNLSLKLVQGGQTKYFAIRSKLNPADDPMEENNLQGWAVNVPQADGEIEMMELYYTPELNSKGFTGSEKLVKRWRKNEANQPVGPVISGRVWNDENRNGKIDPEEKGIAGVRIDAWPDKNGDGRGDGVFRFQYPVTDTNGYYQLGNLTYGTYQVGLSGEANYVANGPLTGFLYDLTKYEPGHGKDILGRAFRINNSEASYSKIHPSGISNMDFGFYKSHTTTLGGKVWNDANNNNKRDPDEKGIAGVKLLLWKDLTGTGQPDYTGYQGEAITNANGDYTFPNLEKGIYQVFVWEVENFESDGALYNMQNCEGEGDPNMFITTDDNGIEGSKAGGPPGSYICKPVMVGERSLQPGTYDYGTGSFISIDGKNWLEKNQDGQKQFECYATDADFVYLKAHAFIKLPRNGGPVYYKMQENGQWSHLYTSKRASQTNDRFDGAYSNGTIDFGFRKK